MLRGIHSLVVLLSVGLATFVSDAQTTASSSGKSLVDPSAGSQHGDIVVLALASLRDSLKTHRGHISESLIGDPNADLEENLLNTQMEIVRKTADFGPVLLIAPDEETRAAIQQHCKDFSICDFLESGQVRTKIVPHEGVWIRDFGPQVEVLAGKPRVVHWRYHDSRVDESHEEQKREINIKRFELLEVKAKVGSRAAIVDEFQDENHQAVIDEIDRKLSALREYSEILSDPTFEDRDSDDRSAFDIADAVLADPDFQRVRSSLSVDGGNLLKLEDGRCLTTRVLLSRNRDADVSNELVRIGNCKQVTYLDPLPGPVIEHVDMFALPVRANAILLASYDLAQPYVKTEWAKLNDAEKDLTFEASLAMKRDAKALRALGYNVIEVPSPLPRAPRHSDPYYPTVLNALVRSNPGGERQVLVPSYTGYEGDVQQLARATIREAFGPSASVVSIEATEAAKAQGAVHCLTLTFPLQSSFLSMQEEEKAREQAEVALHNLEESILKPAKLGLEKADLVGSWQMSDADAGTSGPSDSDASDDESGVMEIKFQADGSFRIRLDSDGPAVAGVYDLEKQAAGTWAMSLKFAGKAPWEGNLNWLDPDHLRLELKEIGALMLTREP